MTEPCLFPQRPRVLCSLAWCRSAACTRPPSGRRSRAAPATRAARTGAAALPPVLSLPVHCAVLSHPHTSINTITMGDCIGTHAHN